MNKKTEYDCANKFELKNKIIRVINEFKIEIVDPTDDKKRIKTDSYWNAHGIKKQTLSSWRSIRTKNIIGSNCEKGKLKLNYAFSFSLLVEKELAEAICFMAIAGYVYKLYPLNHEYHNSPEARCFHALAFVYSNLKNPSEESNDSRFERLELADWYIDTNDPSLLEELLP